MPVWLADGEPDYETLPDFYDSEADEEVRAPLCLSLSRVHQPAVRDIPRLRVWV